jgi:hypothetical protein
MKTAVSLPDELFAAGERVAKRLGLSRSELYARALERFVREHEGAEITRRVNEILDRAPLERLDPLLGRMQSLSLGPDEGTLDDWVDLRKVKRGRRGRHTSR